ncbi:MAG: AAA family ATPase [Actinomycetes bacterium]
MSRDKRGANAGDRRQARGLARALQGLMEWAHAAAPPDTSNEVSRLVRSYLGTQGCEHSVVARDFAPLEHVNLQVALDAWSGEDIREVEVLGVALPPHFGRVSLEQLVHGEGFPPLRLAAPAFADLPNGPGTTLACLRLALLQVVDHRGRYLLMVSGPGEHHNGLHLEVAGLPLAEAQQVLAELDDLRARLNVYRGRLLEVVGTPMGVHIEFAGTAAVPRDEVVLPEAVLARVERHAVGIAAHSKDLRARGQHVKRGMLLYGPPGTGKTHTVRYLMGQLPGYTRILLAGRSLHAIGTVTAMARELEPAVIVLEDVDLVAADRSFGPSGNPVLFELLDAMDGAAPDSDLLFVLTTNRADLLERALAARPGRVDVAVEVGLPDAAAREQLFRLYARGVDLRLSEADIAAAVARTDGVTASFVKELVRRAVLEALEAAAAGPAVTPDALGRALDDLLDSQQAVTRTLLGVPQARVAPTTHSRPGGAIAQAAPKAAGSGPGESGPGESGPGEPGPGEPGPGEAGPGEPGGEPEAEGAVPGLAPADDIEAGEASYGWTAYAPLRGHLPPEALRDVERSGVGWVSYATPRRSYP